MVFVTSGVVSDQCQIFARSFSFIPSQKNFVKIVSYLSEMDFSLAEKGYCNRQKSSTGCCVPFVKSQG